MDPSTGVEQHLCIHGLPAPAALTSDARGDCWCTARFGTAGLINAQPCEFSGEKLLRFRPRRSRMYMPPRNVPPFDLHGPLAAFDGRRGGKR